ncbi:Alpha-glucan water dikinase [Hibiscus syriacus]|uniref:Alpha-glucan water dikinase n=1 Tax=Hibiscus syriacus TaxID=106335 RepID=A0A6A2Y275_HIBSY|nr:Alpha-glucan water dikinase [Hibiscus syriacus]
MTTLDAELLGTCRQPNPPRVDRASKQLKNTPGVPKSSFCAAVSLKNRCSAAQVLDIYEVLWQQIDHKEKQKIAMGATGQLRPALGPFWLPIRLRWINLFYSCCQGWQLLLSADSNLQYANHLVRFNVDGIELQVDASAPTSGSLRQVHVRIMYHSDSLLLHWGCDMQKRKLGTSRQPEGTINYKDRALRNSISEVPEDLVQVQAYLRWERQGRQMYSPEKEKHEEYEARVELLDEIAWGAFVDDIWSKLTKKATTSHCSPPGSVSLGGAAESNFQQALLMIFLNRAAICSAVWREWIKNNGSDFYVEFSQKFKQDADDGKGTSKFLLDRIAELESETQKSFMHRSVNFWDVDFVFGFIVLDLTLQSYQEFSYPCGMKYRHRFMDQAKDTGVLGLAGILVWMRFMATRKLIWNKTTMLNHDKAQDRFTDLLQSTYISHPQYQELLRMITSTVSRGGEDVGQRIRDEFWSSSAIHSEPSFARDQKDGLLRDLGDYMRTLKAVHSGADLDSAISNCTGYLAEVISGKRFYGWGANKSCTWLALGFPELPRFILGHIEDRNVEALVESLLEARQELRPLLMKSSHCLKDLLTWLLTLRFRTAIEDKIIFTTLVLENLALSSDDNEDLIYYLKNSMKMLQLWHAIVQIPPESKWSLGLYAKSILDRTRLALTSKAEWYQRILQPSAEYLGTLLGVDPWAISIFTEEIIRAGSPATLSSLINRLDPVLRKTANLGSWQVISPVEVVGYVDVVEELLAVQDKSYDRPTILVAKRVKGEEEISDGTVAVLTQDMPDVLSHICIRGRNCKVCFAACFDPNILDDIKANKGKLLRLKPSSADVAYSKVKYGDLPGSSNLKGDYGPSSTLVRKQFGGKYAISAEEFTPEMVGAKSRNISYLKGKVPSWIGIPTSVALPFGVFEEGVLEKMQILKKKLGEEDVDALGEIRRIILLLASPPELVKELKTKMQSSGMPWPGDEGEQESKLDHDMAVLVQEIINADYAFVIHATNPSSGDSSEIYAELIRSCFELCLQEKQSQLPQVLGYPSKPIALFIRRSIIFRSDSNGEVLEGYAGAGLYDSRWTKGKNRLIQCSPLCNFYYDSRIG